MSKKRNELASTIGGAMSAIFTESEMYKEEKKEAACARIYYKVLYQKFDSYEDFINSAQNDDEFAEIMEKEGNGNWTLEGIDAILEKYLCDIDDLRDICGEFSFGREVYCSGWEVQLTERGKRVLARKKREEQNNPQKTQNGEDGSEKTKLQLLGFVQSIENAVVNPDDDIRDLIRALSRRKIKTESVWAIIPFIEEDGEFSEGLVFADTAICYLKDSDVWQREIKEIEDVDFDKEMLQIDEKKIDCRDKSGNVTVKPRKLYNLIMDIKEYLEEQEDDA